MIPSSLLGLALFVVLLAPGLAFVLRHERVVPTRSYSAFRETLRVVFVSVACLAIVGLVVAGLRWLLPASTPNIGGLIQHPAAFARRHYVQLAWWTLATVAIATALGAIASDPRVVRRLQSGAKTRPIRLLTGSTKTSIDAISAWHRVAHVFDDDNPGPIVVGAQMDDGTYVEGRLFSFNAAGDEDENREMILSGPLHLTTTNGRRAPYAAQFTVISARHIVRLDITHLPPAATTIKGSSAVQPAQSASSSNPPSRP